MEKFTDEDLEKINNKVLNETNYGKEFEIIEEILKRYPQNDNKLIVALKIALIDITNSTNLSKHKSQFALNDLVEVICHTDNFDTRLEKGDLSLIKDIAICKGINLFSFATKYCCYHNTIVYGKDDYSIYDSILRDYLPKYTENITKYKIEQWRKDIDYESYHNCITDILERNRITLENRRRKFDRFIWYRGKEQKGNNNG